MPYILVLCNIFSVFLVPLAYVPGVPSVPQIDKLTSGYQVEWQPPRDNGQPILNYTLQFW